MSKKFNKNGVYFYTMVEYYNTELSFFYRSASYEEIVTLHCFNTMVEDNLKRYHNSNTCKTINTLYFKDIDGSIQTVYKMRIGL